MVDGSNGRVTYSMEPAAELSFRAKHEGSRVYTAHVRSRCSFGIHVAADCGTFDTAARVSRSSVLFVLPWQILLSKSGIASSSSRTVPSS